MVRSLSDAAIEQLCAELNVATCGVSADEDLVEEVLGKVPTGADWQRLLRRFRADHAASLRGVLAAELTVCGLRRAKLALRDREWWGVAEDEDDDGPPGALVAAATLAGDELCSRRCVESLEAQRRSELLAHGRASASAAEAAAKAVGRVTAPAAPPPPAEPPAAQPREPLVVPDATPLFATAAACALLPPRRRGQGLCASPVPPAPTWSCTLTGRGTSLVVRVSGRAAPMWQVQWDPWLAGSTTSVPRLRVRYCAAGVYTLASPEEGADSVWLQFASASSGPDFERYLIAAAGALAEGPFSLTTDATGDPVSLVASQPSQLCPSSEGLLYDCVCDGAVDVVGLRPFRRAVAAACGTVMGRVDIEMVSVCAGGVRVRFRVRAAKWAPRWEKLLKLHRVKWGPYPADGGCSDSAPLPSRRIQTPELQTPRRLRPRSATARRRRQPPPPAPHPSTPPAHRRPRTPRRSPQRSPQRSPSGWASVSAALRKSDELIHRLESLRDRLDEEIQGSDSPCSPPPSPPSGLRGVIAAEAGRARSAAAAAVLRILAAPVGAAGSESLLDCVLVAEGREQEVRAGPAVLSWRCATPASKRGARVLVRCGSGSADAPAAEVADALRQAAAAWFDVAPD